MTDRLLSRFDDELRRAKRWSAGDDPLPVLEALGYAVALHLVGELEAVSTASRGALALAGRGAIDASRTFAAAGSEDADAYEEAARLGELGVRLLAGKGAGSLDGVPADAMDPTDGRIARMLRGELDGLSAGACAVRCMKRDDARPRVLRAVERRATEDAAALGAERIRLAAADAAPVRAPEDGRLVATLEDTLLEAVYFPAERQLAVYAASATFLQVVGTGVTPRDAKPGYWLGDVDASAGPTLELEVRIAGRVVRWGVDLE